MNVSSGYNPDRITITTDMGAKVEDVKVYKGWIADLACWAGFAKKIQDTQGNSYVVNIRSVGKAWAYDSDITRSHLTNKVKDEFAKQFFNQIGKDQITSEFLKELKSLFSQGEGALVQNELGRLKRLPNEKPHLNTQDERVMLYTRIRGAMLTQFSSKKGDAEWPKKVNQCFPVAEGMEKVEFEKLIKILSQID